MRGEFAGFSGLSAGGKGRQGKGEKEGCWGETVREIIWGIGLWMVKRNDRRGREMV